MIEASVRRPHLKVGYWIFGHEEPDGVASFDDSNVPASQIGLPSGRAPEKATPGDDRYSGMHDHGCLPSVREEGHGTIIVGSIKMAKKFNDDYISGLLEARKVAELSRTEDQPTKRAKTDRKATR